MLLALQQARTAEKNKIAANDIQQARLHSQAISVAQVKAAFVGTSVATSIPRV